MGGHDVDCFADDSTGRFVFHFSELGDVSQIDAISFLQDERSQKAFAEDKKMLDWADVVVMLHPCGKSSHLEAGYAVGAGKKLFMLGDFPKGEFDVMYGFADFMARDIFELKAALVNHTESNLIDKIGTSQVLAGEQAVLDNLKRLGL